MSYDHQAIEARWQKRWETEKVFEVDMDPSRPKFYNVAMYPYPSGELHMGHLRNYTYIDLITRYKMMRGFNVLSPMGWDSFGLPAENRAIDDGVHPRLSVESQIEKMKWQFRRLGAGFDWSRELASHHPDFYKWDQWLFLELYERGLAYKASSAVNWCPKDQTVLANEQVVDGLCERCGTPVVRRELSQWFFKITDYSDRLLDSLDTLNQWPERVRTMQRNWIGRSEGATFAIDIVGGGSFDVFTTRPDTIFGMTFCVLAPEHPEVESLIDGSPNEEEARAYVEAAQRFTDVERLTHDVKTGVFTGAHAVNPANGQHVPIYIADYVLMSYGTGAIMGVPGQDQRDWDFATKYGIDIVRTVEPPSDWEGEAYLEDGPTINSDFLNDLDREAAVEKIIDWLEEQEIGRADVQWRLRDWLISRQRYWGCPIPMINCKECGLVPVPREDLPVLLPDVSDFAPKGKSPLATVEEFVATTCPRCGGDAERETDTMDTFVDSSWYYFRYTDPHNEDAIFEPDKAEYWMPLDQYIGGVEHAVLHLLYARFITKFLYDIGLSSVEEPFQRLFTQGMLTKDGAAMSKSKGNVVPPDRYYEQDGADAIRLFELFVGPPTDDAVWNDSGVAGTRRFLDRVWRMATEDRHHGDRGEDERDREILSVAHRTVRKVTEDIEGFRFNTAVPALMILANELQEYVGDEPREEIVDEVLRLLVLMLSPMAPHIAHELWDQLGHGDMLALEAWPEWDPELAAEETVTLIIQVDGKVRDRVEVSAELTAEEAEQLARSSEKVREFLDGREIERVVARPPDVVNLVTR